MCAFRHGVLMTTHTGKLAPMTNYARGFVRHACFIRVQIHPAGRVRGRSQIRSLAMAGLATIRIIDLYVADQAVRHLREIEPGDLLGFGHPAVACAARIAVGAEVTPDIAGRLQVFPPIDSARDQRRNIPHPQMKGVVESSHPGGGWIRDGHVLMAAPADFASRKQVVRYLRAGERGRMAGSALQLQLQVEAM
jgi:hypothetical protein